MLNITPGKIESDGHVVLLPAGLTGEVTLKDGSVVDLGPANQAVIEVASHEQAKEVVVLASQMAVEDENVDVQEFDEATTRKNLTNKKKG